MLKSEFKTKVQKANINQLMKLGFKKFNEKSPTLMLIPKKLFDSIPQGYPVTDIFGKSEKFDKNKSDNDERFGCLSFGILKHK